MLVSRKKPSRLQLAGAAARGEPPDRLELITPLTGGPAHIRSDVSPMEKGLRIPTSGMDVAQNNNMEV